MPSLLAWSFLVPLIQQNISHRLFSWRAISNAIKDTKQVICCKQEITIVSENWKIVSYTINVQLMEQNWIVLRLRIRNLSKFPIQKAIYTLLPLRFLKFMTDLFHHSNIIHRILILTLIILLCLRIITQNGMQNSEFWTQFCIQSNNL